MGPNLRYDQNYESDKGLIVEDYHSSKNKSG